MKILVEVIRTIRTPLVIDIKSMDDLDESFQVAEEELGDPTFDDVEINYIRKVDD